MKLFTILRNMIAKAKAYTDMKFGLMGDYVVERGTSGIWTYRKWASGIAECWGTSSSTQIPQGSLYVDHTLTFPFDLYLSQGGMNVTFGANTNTIAQRNVPVPTVFAFTDTTITVREWRNINDSSGGASPSFFIRVIGKWKV